MGNGKNMHADWREARRFRAIKLWQQGWRQCEIAEALGVTEGAVSQWLTAYRCEGGLEAIKARNGAGRPAKIPRNELDPWLERQLLESAERWGFAGDYWTRRRVVLIIKDRFGVRFDDTRAGVFLKRLGFKLVVPSTACNRRDEEAIRKWREQRWPEVQKKRSAKAARSAS